MSASAVLLTAVQVFCQFAVYTVRVPESAKLAMVSAYVYLQEGNIAEGEQRINLAIRHALLRCDTPHGRSGGVVA